MDRTKYFQFQTTETIAQKMLLVHVHLICIDPACKSHSSAPSQLKKRPDPKMLFFYAPKNSFYTSVTQASFNLCPRDLLQVYVHAPQK